MSSKYGEQFDKALRLLRDKLPISVPVVVRTKVNLVCDDTGEDLFGQCMAHFNTRKRITRFVIDIVRGLEVEIAIDTLLHEWAHAVDMTENGHADDEDAHRDSWGAAYAKVWRVFTDEDK
jgi:hypothetical protein